MVTLLVAGPRTSFVKRSFNFPIVFVILSQILLSQPLLLLLLLLLWQCACRLGCDCDVHEE